MERHAVNDRTVTISRLDKGQLVESLRFPDVPRIFDQMQDFPGARAVLVDVQPCEQLVHVNLERDVIQNNWVHRIGIQHARAAVYAREQTCTDF